MKILGELILHYAAPYLQAALESVSEQVDHIVILYAEKPSQGYQPNILCPDSREDLRKIAEPFGDKITWVDGQWHHEGEHCDAIADYMDGYDFVFRFDGDEVIPPGFVAEMIHQANETNHKNYCVPFVHFWRSFNWACRDGQMPVRLHRINGGEGQRYLDSKDGKWFVYHFGYAQPTKYIEYKLQCSAHRPEFRPDWFEKKWLANAKDDVHPVCFPDHWNAEPFDKSTMPEVLKRHPYYNAEVIE